MRRRKLRSYMKEWIVYETRNKRNGKIYVGTHGQKIGTHFDGYLGSGVVLREAIRKYGKEAFERHTLSTHSTELGAYAEERRIVCRDFVERRDTYNTAIGGLGGDRFSTHPKKEEYRRKLQEASIKNGAHKHLPESRGENNGFYGKTHSEASNELNRLANSGANHSSSIHWIYDGVEYGSIRECARETGRSHHYVKKYGRRKQNKSM